VIASRGLTIDSVARHSRRPLPPLPPMAGNLKARSTSSEVIATLSKQFPVPPGAGVRHVPSTPAL
jgi:hypothetical protein